MVGVYDSQSVHDLVANDEKTTIEIRKSTWFRLYKRKGFGESFDKVVNRLLNEVEKNGKQNKTGKKD